MQQKTEHFIVSFCLRTVRMLKHCNDNTRDTSTHDIDMPSPAHTPPPKGDQGDYMQQYSISSGQPPSEPMESSNASAEAKEQKKDILVSEATLNNYVQTKVGYIATFIIKLAALEH